MSSEIQNRSDFELPLFHSKSVSTSASVSNVSSGSSSGFLMSGSPAFPNLGSAFFDASQHTQYDSQGIAISKSGKSGASSAPSSSASSYVNQPYLNRLPPLNDSSNAFIRSEHPSAQSQHDSALKLFINNSNNSFDSFKGHEPFPPPFNDDDAAVDGEEISPELFSPLSHEVESLVLGGDDIESESSSHCPSKHLVLPEQQRQQQEDVFAVPRPISQRLAVPQGSYSPLNQSPRSTQFSGSAPAPGGVFLMNNRQPQAAQVQHYAHYAPQGGVPFAPPQVGPASDSSSPFGFAGLSQPLAFGPPPHSQTKHSPSMQRLPSPASQQRSPALTPPVDGVVRRSNSEVLEGYSQMNLFGADAAMVANNMAGSNAFISPLPYSPAIERSSRSSPSPVRSFSGGPSPVGNQADFSKYYQRPSSNPVDQPKFYHDFDPSSVACLSGTTPPIGRPNTSYSPKPNARRSFDRPRSGGFAGGSGRGRGSGGAGIVHFDYDQMSIMDYPGHILDLCESQDGCRYLQRVVENGTIEEVSYVFQNMLGNLSTMMCDSLANYICQKMFERCNEDQRHQAIHALSSDVYGVSCNVHGTRALQKLIDVLRAPSEMAEMRVVLQPHILRLVQDGNGSHVVQRVLNKFTTEYKQFIYDILMDSSVMELISTHRHGCCVVQRALDFASDEQKAFVVAKVVEHSFVLVQDAFGNYVVQYVLEMAVPDIATRFARNLRGRFIELAMQKFSSNVVEKIMNSGEKEALDIILEEIINCKDMPRLLQDPYANYVVQTALTTASDAQHKRLAAVIIPHQSVFRNTLYSKRIMAKLYRDSPGTNSGSGGGGHGVSRSSADRKRSHRR